ncbi:MAG: winged helix-turn-helix transcriptional regulator [Bifidobacteriaceae bacterium]|nr:winged helix-turn-helix transcriptional regulator [Bifidobacteriaceae bacterium]
MKRFYTDQPSWVDKAGKIYAALELIKASERRNPNALTLRRHGRISAIHSTTAIEGNRLDLDAAVLAALALNGRLTRPDLAAALGKTPRTVERSLAKLKAAGRLRRVGSAKTGIWEVIP